MGYAAMSTTDEERMGREELHCPSLREKVEKRGVKKESEDARTRLGKGKAAGGLKYLYTSSASSNQA